MYSFKHQVRSKYNFSYKFNWKLSGELCQNFHFLSSHFNAILRFIFLFWETVVETNVFFVHPTQFRRNGLFKSAVGINSCWNIIFKTVQELRMRYGRYLGLYVLFSFVKSLSLNNSLQVILKSITIIWFINMTMINIHRWSRTCFVIRHRFKTNWLFIVSSLLSHWRQGLPCVGMHNFFYFYFYYSIFT